MTITLIAAVADDGTIGKNSSLPWHLPEDMAHFRTVTMGHAVIMGRRTFESIGRPLPGRRTIILSHDVSYEAPGCLVVHSIEEALAAAGDDPEVFIAGGEQLYRLFLPLAERILLTRIHARYKGDAHFPPIPPVFREADRRQVPGEPPLTILDLVRRSAKGI